jgi:hypothetical protein
MLEKKKATTARVTAMALKVNVSMIMMLSRSSARTAVGCG